MTRWYAPAESAGTTSAAEPVYRRDALVVAADALGQAPDALSEVNARLAEVGWAGWSLTPADLPPDAEEAVLRLTGPGGGEPPNASELLRSVRKAGGWTPAASTLVDKLAEQRMLFVGLPAKDGFGGTGRRAISVVGRPPRRSRMDEVPGGRRPVIVLPDSGVGPHPWLGTSTAVVDPDPFWVNAADYGWGPVDMSWVPTTQGTGDTNPADDELDSHAGHATFIAGLIRQVAPDARVLSAPIMRTGGVVDEDAVLYTLRWVRDRVRGAAADSTLFVDIVSLSFGYYEQAAENAFHTSKLREVLGELGDLGVRVVAAAGNRASADPVYPAALAGAPWAGDAPETRLISVGALNPDGSRAVYSNHGDWVTHWDFGTAVAGPTPPFGQQAARGQTAEYDPENLVGGFASWAGTSFATGLFAGRLAAELMADPRWAGLAQTMTPAAAHQRAAWALAALTPS